MFEHTDHACARQRSVDFNRSTFAAEVVVDAPFKGAMVRPEFALFKSNDLKIMSARNDRRHLLPFVTERKSGMREERMQMMAELSHAQLMGDLYARWTLDCVIEIAYAVSRDFVARPEFYKDREVSERIVDLRMEYGTRSAVPNTTLSG